MQVSINSCLVNKVLIRWEVLGINIAHIYAIIWSEYINHSLKKGKCIEKGRNIFSIVLHRSQCFSLWIHAIIEHQFFLVTFMMLNLQKTVWHWHIPPEILTNTIFFQVLQKFKRNQDVIWCHCLTLKTMRRGLWGLHSWYCDIQ